MPYGLADGSHAGAFPKLSPREMEAWRARRWEEERRRDEQGEERMQEAKKLAETLGLRGLTERMKALQEEGDRRIREIAEEAVVEELAREGRSWGPS